MKILIALPLDHPKISSIDDIIDGTTPASGTISSIVRVAVFLADAGYSIFLSSASPCYSSKINCISHTDVDSNEFDKLIVHQSHWNGNELSFGNRALTKTSLWFHNQTVWSFLHNFWQKGGNKAIFPSLDCANAYRALPQWANKARVIYNSYSPVFEPNNYIPQARLLFIGAIKPSKGFREVMQLWSYLVQKKVNLQLAIAGSIRVHSSSIATGSMGIGELEFETKEIQPWLKTLPENYQPKFLGALPPIELHQAICESWSVIVNPSWKAPETFCCSAVEAQACDRTVFGIAAGGLKETVYQGQFKTLTTGKSPEALGDLILKGLGNMEAVAENGRLAGEFVRSQFNQQKISDTWIQLLSGQSIDSNNILSIWDSPKALAYDFLRWTGTGMAVKSVYGKLRNRPH